MPMDGSAESPITNQYIALRLPLSGEGGLLAARVFYAIPLVIAMNW